MVCDVVTGCFVRIKTWQKNRLEVSTCHYWWTCVIKGENICCINEITKGQTVISETCHFNLHPAVILVDFSNDSRACCVIQKHKAGEIESGCQSGFRCYQSMACLKLIASCIARPSSKKINSHRYIIRLSVKMMMCKFSLKGDRLSKQNILPTSGRVCFAMGRLLHTTENIRADIPQRTNNVTKCALFERKSKTQSQG